MDETALVNPFVIRRPNHCIRCDNELLLISYDITIQSMDDKGRPTDVEYNECRFKMHCPMCGAVYHAKPDDNGMSFRPSSLPAVRKTYGSEVEVPVSVFNAPE